MRRLLASEIKRIRFICGDGELLDVEEPPSWPLYGDASVQQPCGLCGDALVQQPCGLCGDASALPS
jgi:hypothetical protein